ncbi:hypothetical protein Y032_0877g2818, partial [Ancylostoma ceylanicum]
MIWDKETCRAPVTNDLAGAKLFRAGEEVGRFEPLNIVEEQPVKYQGNMLERTAEKLKDREQRLMMFLKGNKQDDEFNEAIQLLVNQHASVFAVTDQEPSQTNLVEHKIETRDAEPIRQKARPIPLATRVELRRILNDLQERRVIEPSKSSWATLIVLVQKKDGTLRLCVDYRNVNQVTRVDSYPLPTIDSILQSLKGKGFFSTLDLSSGYWQISLPEDAKQKSAFTTTEGLYQFCVLPFGLSSSPPVFQRLMHTVLGPLLGEEVFCYLDDIIIATDTVERHLQMLENVFNALQGAGLKLNPRKCVLLEKKVEFLGHVIDREGLHMDPSKVEAIVNYPLPQSRSELRTFLGMCSYYRKFVLGFAKVAAPLHELTSEKTKFEWTTERKACFDQLKRIITQAPVLAQPDIEGARSGKKPFRIHTDASYLGLGGMLSQKGDGGLTHPISFASKGLTNCEKRYHVTDLEAPAVIFALWKFHMFVYGLPRTNVSARVLRWAVELQKYNLKMIYLKGAANRVADAFSRGATSHQDSQFEEPIPNELIVASTTEESDWTRELREHPTYGQIMSDLEEGKLSGMVKSPGTSRTYRVADFVINRGFLENDQLRKIVPPSKRKDVFNGAHHGMLAGHFGAKKIFRELSKRLFWESMRRDIILWIEECRDCFCHNGRRDMVPPLKPIVT